MDFHRRTAEDEIDVRGELSTATFRSYIRDRAIVTVAYIRLGQ